MMFVHSRVEKKSGYEWERGRFFNGWGYCAAVSPTFRYLARKVYSNT